MIFIDEVLFRNPSAWFSELYKERESIKFNIKMLPSCVCLKETARTQRMRAVCQSRNVHQLPTLISPEPIALVMGLFLTNSTSISPEPITDRLASIASPSKRVSPEPITFAESWFTEPFLTRTSPEPWTFIDRFPFTVPTLMSPEPWTESVASLTLPARMSSSPRTLA